MSEPIINLKSGNVTTSVVLDEIDYWSVSRSYTFGASTTIHLKAGTTVTVRDDCSGDMAKAVKRWKERLAQVAGS